ncbi:MAG TPA: hypothetical protein VFS77_11205, partial [Pyrinomonadaceae bacterium]|nr:hypothetical protein [Pyrinomonadaceae bacterium]
DIDLYQTKRWRRGNYAELEMVAPDQKPGISGHPQADSLGDRGEFDEDNSGGGKLYVGRFDRKLHLYGAEWGAWTVDKNAEFHGGNKTPSPKPSATRVEEVVKYTDTDKNGFLDLIEFDYDGDRTIDLRVSLLDYKSAAQPVPDGAVVLNTPAAGWKGLNEAFTEAANQSFQEALLIYRAAWRRGLTTPEIDKLANASSVGQRYHNAYWIKEKIFREIRAQIKHDKALEQELIRLYYLGSFNEYARKISLVPGR